MTNDFKIVNYEEYSEFSLGETLETYISDNASVKSLDLVQELKIVNGDSNTVIGAATQFNSESGTVSVRLMYETKNININKYKVKIDCLGKTIDGKILIDKIRNLILVK